MKLFQQLLVAPAALGLLAPLAANAAEVNINNVVDYANPSAASVTVLSSPMLFQEIGHIQLYKTLAIAMAV